MELEKEQVWCCVGPAAQMIWLRTCSQSRNSHRSHTGRYLFVFDAKNTAHFSGEWRVCCGNFSLFFKEWEQVSGFSIEIHPDYVRSHMILQCKQKAMFLLSHFCVAGALKKINVTETFVSVSMLYASHLTLRNYFKLLFNWAYIRFSFNVKSTSSFIWDHIYRYRLDIILWVHSIQLPFPWWLISEALFCLAQYDTSSL